MRREPHPASPPRPPVLDEAEVAAILDLLRRARAAAEATDRPAGQGVGK